MIAENLKIVREKIRKKCIEIGRNPDEIKLIAVSKNFDVKDIKDAIKEGVTDFGENRAQELVAKYSELKNSVTWHFIGVLQRNKVRFAVETADVIHSVDSLMLASEINKRAKKIDKIQKILLEIKTSGEESKSGLINESEIFDLAEYCKEYKNVELIGLMTIAPFTDDKNLIRKSFSYLRTLKEKLNKKGYNLKELSMGMTGDFEIAIEEGATMLRIGSAIFGMRNYSVNREEL